MTADEIITDIIKREGSVYTNDPKDHGGPTKYGITQATLAEYRGHPVTPDDVKNMGETEARAIYQKRYVDAAHFNQINYEPLRVELIDYGVNSGPSRAVRGLQAVLGVAVDGQMGPQTLAKANAAEGRGLLNKLAIERLKFLVGLGVDDSTQLKYVRGWVNRASSFIQ